MNNFLKNTGLYNTPELAYYVRTGKEISVDDYYSKHETREINGIEIDKNIPEDIMLSLLNNSKIEMRYSCEGSDIHGPFLIFRLINFSDHETTNKFCELMNDENIICKYSDGKEDQFRIIVTSTFTGEEVDLDICNKWWKNINEKIQEILKDFKEEL